MLDSVALILQERLENHLSIFFCGDSMILAGVRWPEYHSLPPSHLIHFTQLTCIKFSVGLHDTPTPAFLWHQENILIFYISHILRSNTLHSSGCSDTAAQSPERPNEHFVSAAASSLVLGAGVGRVSALAGNAQPQRHRQSTQPGGQKSVQAFQFLWF